MPKAFVNRQRVESPLENWPGYIVIPQELTPEDFTRWYEYQNREGAEADTRPELFQTWGGRFHLIREWHIEGLDNGQIDESGAALPSMRIIMFMIAATQDLITAAGSLPNLHGSSNGDENGTPHTES